MKKTVCAAYGPEPHAERPDQQQKLPAGAPLVARPL